MKLIELKKLVDGAVLQFGEDAEIGYFNPAGDFTTSEADISKENGNDALILWEA